MSNPRFLVSIRPKGQDNWTVAPVVRAPVNVTNEAFAAKLPEVFRPAVLACVLPRWTKGGPVDFRGIQSCGIVCPNGDYLHIRKQWKPFESYQFPLKG